MRQRGKGGVGGGCGGRQAFDVEPAVVVVIGVDDAAVAQVEVQGGEGPGVREEVGDCGVWLEVVVAAEV